jgi:ribosomal protein S19
METVIIYKKNIYIQLKDLNKKFLIYNGKNFQKLIISENMIGYRFGEFVTTRKVIRFNKKN